MADLEIQAIEGGEVVGRYIGPPRRAASWARRANPNATLRAVAQTTAPREAVMNNEAGPMDADTPEIVEAVKAAFGRCGYAGFEEGKDALARAAIVAARPFILEEAARVAREFMFEHCSCLGDNDKEDLIRSLSGEGLDAK